MWLNVALAGGESGIRTHGTLTGTPDFESGTFGRSVISPPRTMTAGTRAVNVTKVTLIQALMCDGSDAAAGQGEEPRDCRGGSFRAIVPA
jgi:hypothetical protein